MNEVNIAFESWSVEKAFSQLYFPGKISCDFCQIPRCQAHMCVYNSGEIVKMQACLDGASRDCWSHVFPPTKVITHVCASCFIKCKPDTRFKKRVKESMRTLEGKMSLLFDANFIAIFMKNIFEFLIKESTLTCVPCSLDLHDYKWETYNSSVSSHRKRRLESI